MKFPNQAWGKRHGSGGELLLVNHCADVAAVALSLMRLPSWRKRLERLAERQLTDIDLARLGALSFLHDVGKANVGFQAKRFPDLAARHEWLRGSGIGDGDCGHTAIALCLLAHDFRKEFAARIPLVEIDEWNGRDLWLASISHHGDPIWRTPDQINTRARRAFVTPWKGYAPLDALSALGESVRRWFPAAFVAAQPLPDAAAFVHAFSGVVSLADWIASGARETAFPFEAGGEDRFVWALTRAADVLRNMGLDIERERAAALALGKTFQRIFSFAPTPLQKAIGADDLGPLVIAEDETGGGKTEAALWRFKTLFEAGEVDSLAFVLPTRVAAVSLEERVRFFMEKWMDDPFARLATVLAVPGYISVDGVEGQRLAAFETLWPDDDAHANAHRRWAAEHPKRYLAAPVAVGTVDQALLAAITSRHAHLRGAALMRSLLVVDEVHASDAFMTTTLKALLDRHLKAGGHALLLSATLGSAARTRFFGARTPSAIAAREVSYPAVSDHKGVRSFEGAGRSKSVAVSLEAAIADLQAVAKMAAVAVNNGARVLVLRNTVGGVLQVQSELEAIVAQDALFRAGGVVAPHHGRFAAEDRKLLDAAIEAAFGKNARHEGARVVCGSQTLEISLDIDADLLITDLAPMDVLLQRIGRLHRHKARSERGRPAGYETPRVIVLTPHERDLSPFLHRKPNSQGLGSVYSNVLSIEATWRALEAAALTRLELPTENRRLVEDTTHPEILCALAENLGENWRRHWQDLRGGELAQRNQAAAQLLDWDAEWMDQSWAEPGERVRTRLGLDDRIVEFSTPVISPFGQTLPHIKLPGWMIHGADAKDEPIVAQSAEPGILTFDFAGETWIYDRLGIRKRDVM
ncbi:MAG: CRISPR-associated helicase Cas3' [Hyphomicrobiales bacterium]|nr:CRISPR-associated helicase Cas3' [Hyphomicrobiales bacterium]